MSQDKDEILAMAHEADDTIRSKPFTAEMLSFLERFATLCRAPLVAEVERLIFTLTQESLTRENVSALRAQLAAENAVLKQAHEINADTLNAMQVEIDDWKVRALKSEQAGEPNSLERFATLCRAPLVAENAALNADMKQMGTDLSAIQEIHNQQKAKLYAELADWKARALKAEQT